MRREFRLPGPLGMSGHLSLWGASSLIKSIQRGTVTNAAPAATISAVVMANTQLRLTGFRNNATNANVESLWLTKVVLTDATTVTGSVGTAGATWTATFEVIEYVPGVIKSMQRGTFAYTSMSTGNAGVLTITEVNPDKAFVEILGRSSDYAAVTTDPRYACQSAVLAATSVTFVSASDPNGSGGTWTISYEVTEWY